ncbi:hypothetical protein QCA50_021065 [Cerrena zonata]|uniref:Uncharacterized protein n=1 Tax=Cerrena zonata TaxID=2478898 RepID=A0AAW0F899_9APHY
MPREYDENDFDVLFFFPFSNNYSCCSSKFFEVALQLDSLVEVSSPGAFELGVHVFSSSQCARASLSQASNNRSDTVSTVIVIRVIRPFHHHKLDHFRRAMLHILSIV